jgi:hypothetical protein
LSFILNYQFTGHILKTNVCLLYFSLNRACGGYGLVLFKTRKYRVLAAGKAREMFVPGGQIGATLQMAA